MNAAAETAMRFHIIDAQGVPLPSMVPVASEGPSMLAEIISQGAPADAGGISVLRYPREKWVYVRAADPSGRLMATTYVEFKPGEAVDPDEPMTLEMAPAAAVTATLHDQAGAPIAGEAADLLMIHPAHGQWWRADSDIDASGSVEFKGLPAGVYALKIELGGAEAATFREVVLTGGEVKDLGVVSPKSGE